MRYLVYESASDEIVVANEKPQGFTGTTHQELVGNLVSVWHAPAVSGETILVAIRILLARMRGFPFAEVNSAVEQIVSKYLPNQYSFMALGASPKLIKWVLKRKGYNAVAISVSKVTAKAKPTGEFLEYVKRKLAKITNNNIVLMDFVESGESLVEVKSVLSGLWKRGVVAAVALGTGSKFEPDGAYAAKIDYVVKNIPNLTKGFEMNTYKQILGRNKDMRDYATFPGPVKGGNVLAIQQRQFAAQKSAFARAAELGPIELNLEEFMEIAESEHSDADDDFDSMEAAALSGDEL
jgi:hypothetical protein